MQQPNYGLPAIHEEKEEIKKEVNLLPRAVLRKNSFVLLDGEWEFALDIEDVGLKEEWFKGHHYTNTANWPGSIENHIREAKGEGGFWKDKVVAWYERSFPRPEMTASEQKHKLIQLSFGACGYETMVWLNGIQLKTIEGETVHTGEYTSFSYELDENILQAENRITVRICDTMDADIPRGKQESHVYKRGGIWYQTYTGAVRGIWLETVERNRLRSRVGVVSIVEDKLVRFTLTLRIHDEGEYIIRLRILSPGENTPLATSDFPITLATGQRNQRVTMEIPGAKLWSPEDPYLYHLHAELIDSKGNIAAIETRFGLRKIEARGCCVYLNNKAVYLDGILYQPGIASYEQITKHMHAMKELGCNLVRIHIAGVDPRIYNLADQLGLMLWVEVPSPHRSSPRSRINHKEELLRMLALIATHPSVVIWSLYNEDWGAQDIATNPETRNYIMEMYHFMHVAFPQFLVVDNDGWQHISYEGRLKSDLLTVHLYTPDLEKWKELLDRLEKGEMEGVAAFPLVVGDPFYYRNHLPLVISEWGGFGFKDYGGPSDESEKAGIISLYKEELRKRNIAGDVYTQATNIEEERNGLIDEESGSLKVPAGILKSALK